MLCHEKEIPFHRGQLQPVRTAGLNADHATPNVVVLAAAAEPVDGARRNVIPVGLARFTDGSLPPQPTVERLSPAVVCVLAGNPSHNTLNGTNCFIVGTGKRRILIDSGESGKLAKNFVESLQRVMHDLGVESIENIIATHMHHDHIGGAHLIAKRLGGRSGCRISKFPTPVEDRENRRELVREAQKEEGLRPHQRPKAFPARYAFEGYVFEKRGYDAISDGQIIRTEGATLRATHTPGHASDHLVFELLEEQRVFSGDHVLGWGTSWIQDLRLYVESLHKIAGLKPRSLYPGHGPFVVHGAHHVQRYISHHSAREQQVLNLLRERAREAAATGIAPGMTSRQIVDQLYTNTNEDMKTSAEGNVLKILRKLFEERQIRCADQANAAVVVSDNEGSNEDNANDGGSDPVVPMENYTKVWSWAPSRL